MYSPALGLGWILWQRHRFGLSVFAAYLCVLVIVTRLLPFAPSEPVKGMLTVSFSFGLLYLMAVFANTEADLSSTRSGYAYSLFTLPVRTRSLTLWPMLYGIVTVTSAWILFAVLVLVPRGSGALVWWPATLMAALMVCLQALTWYPIPLPYLRGILALAVLATVIGFGILGWENGLSAELLGAVNLAIIPLAAIVATRGVSLARSGATRERTWLSARSQKEVVRSRFASPLQAQTWLEWKRNGLLLPLLTFLVCLLFTLPTLLMSRDAGVTVPLGIWNIQVPLSTRLWLQGLGALPFLAMAIGCCPNKAETYRPDLTLQPFLATRPLSSVDLVLAKLRSAALSTSSACAFLLLFCAAALLTPAQVGDKAGTLGRLLLPFLTLKSTLLLSLLFVCIIVWTWKCQVSNLWIELTGRRWLVKGYAVGSPMLMVTILDWSIIKAVRDPSAIPRALHFLPYIACCMALLKGITVVWALLALRRYDLVTYPVLKRFLALWLLAAAGLGGLLLWLLPSGIVPARYITLGVFLFLPLARLLLAPLAMHWNRHR